MWRLVPALTKQMGQAYPELVRAESLIEETLRLEETRFGKTLARGLQILDDETRGLVSGGTLSGDVAFKLYDTYGFPLDLTQDALKSREIAVDLDGFSTAMERQKAEARRNWTGTGEAATETLWFAIRDRVGATDFLGYDTEQAEGVVSAILVDGQEVSALQSGQQGAIVLNQTPFYGESGGQVGDAGELRSGDNVARVIDCQRKIGDLIVHFVEVLSGSFEVGNAVELLVDHGRRSAVRANHSATHLLHEALRLTLGDHIAQKGSYVSADRLRFDFSHPKPIADDELAQIEDLANTVIVKNSPVITRLMAVDDAIDSGARALFGEKYGDEVRVVSMGQGAGHRSWSVELCGGTHVKQTGDIGVVAVVSETAVSAGVRRIEALTGAAARRYFADQEARVQAVAALLKVPPADIVERLSLVLEERRRLERELGDAKKKLAMGGGGDAPSAVRDIAGTKVFARVLTGVKPNDLKSLADDAKKQIGSGVAVLVGVSEDGKAGIVVGVTADLVTRFNAVDLVKIGSEAVGGKGGGGRPDMAQAGGPDGGKADAALDAILKALG
jgi:alanyl-tRNA synthetase